MCRGKDKVGQKRSENNENGKLELLGEVLQNNIQECLEELGSQKVTGDRSLTVSV
jgi:hypothetical protein